MTKRLKVVVSAFGATGHVFPALALSRRLRARGHEVLAGDREEAAPPVAEEQGLRFIRAPEYIALPRPLPGNAGHPTLAQATEDLVPVPARDPSRTWWSTTSPPSPQHSRPSSRGSPARL